MGNPSDAGLRLAGVVRTPEYHLLPADALALNGVGQPLSRAPQDVGSEETSGGGGGTGPGLLDLNLPRSDPSSGSVTARNFELDPAKYQASLIKKRNGKILLGVGGGLLVAGLGVLLAGALTDKNLSESKLGITGITVMGVSVPFLIAGTVQLVQGNNLVR